MALLLQTEHQGKLSHSTLLYDGWQCAVVVNIIQRMNEVALH